MSKLTALELAALTAVLQEMGNGPPLDQRVLRASALSRENTGGGFYTELALFGEEPPPVFGNFGDDVWMAVDGLDYGLGIILHLSRDEVPLLEGYSVGGENTGIIDFERAAFALIAEPGPYLKNGS